MSLINFLGLSDSGYGNIAKGILYVICEIFWKIMHAVGNLIDVITGLFYKIAGSNYQGSGSENLVEEQDLLSRIFNQNIISTLSIVMIFISISLMALFGVIAVVKQLYFSKDDKRPMSDIIKNMVLGFIFLISLTPIAMFAISSISTLSSLLIGVFGDTSNVSLADLLFNSSFSSDAVGAYNTLYTTEITNWTQMENNFLFDSLYGDTPVNVTFYWYVYLLGGGVILYNLIVMVFKLVKRVFLLAILYIIAPVHVARMVDDGGSKFKEWKNKALSELISVIGTVVSFMILISLVGVISELELVKETVESVDGEFSPIAGIKALVDGEEPGVAINPTAVLINNLTRVFLVMAGTSVAKDSGELLGNVFKGANDDSASLLEGIFNKLGPKETSVTSKTESNGPRTRVITRNTTTTKRIIDYSESIPAKSSGERAPVNINNNNRNVFNNNVTNIDRHVNNIQNRANLSVDGSRSSNSGIRSGSYRENGSSNNQANKLTQALNREFTSVKNDNRKLRGEWDFVKNGNSASSNAVVKEFEQASNELNSSITSGEQTKIKNSMNRYVEAYKKEEKVAKEGYREFAGKSVKLTNDLSAKQQQELRNISEAYHKAQVDYSKTARKLNEVSQGNMSAADALRLKERADKQREKLMEASSKANAFYNNQKRGE